VGDTESIGGKVAEAGIAVAEQAVQTAVNQGGIEEVVADKGYHSNDVLRKLAEWKLRSYVTEPERGARKWKGKAAEQAAVYANRRRISGERGKRLQAGRGERVERNFAHQFDTRGLDRLYVRGLQNVHKKILIQAAACNLALLILSLYGTGKPKAAHDRRSELLSAILRLYSALIALCRTALDFSSAQESKAARPSCGQYENSARLKPGDLGTGC
jgi:transposase